MREIFHESARGTAAETKFTKVMERSVPRKLGIEEEDEPDHWKSREK